MGFEFLLLIGGIAVAIGLTRRISRLEERVRELHHRLIRIDPGLTGAILTRPIAHVAPSPLAERDLAADPAPLIDNAPAPDPAARPLAATPPPTPPPPIAPDQPPRMGIESLIGGKLPIWIGGAALVLAGFFLVRYSIESGLIGPAVRVALAAIFSILLIAAAEAARRLAITRDDPRIGQVLAGAGIASAYGTLYIAGAQYALIGAIMAFVLMVAVTAGALALALRHGPPTAIMALIGGFAAPLVAGFDAAGLGALLAYLALLIAAVFGLAIHRGWAWLAIAAVVAGFAWVNLLVVSFGDTVDGIAGFVVVLAIGATLALPRTGEARRWLRVAPLIAGLVQLLVLAPALQFGALAWTFYLVLAGAALILAWRDETLLPGAVAGAVLVVVMIAIGLQPPGESGFAATAMFGAVGGLLSRRDPRWAAIALVGLAGPVLAAHAATAASLDNAAWMTLELAAAVACAAIAWRHRDASHRRDVGLVGGTIAAAVLAAIGIGTLTGLAWAPVVLAPLIVALGAWAHRTGDADLGRLPAIAFVAILLVGGETLAGLISAALGSLVGDRLPFTTLPPLADVLRQLAPPVVAASALLAWHRDDRRPARGVAGACAILAVVIAYVLAKQPLAIADPARFVAVGFVERAVITLAIFAAGWAIVRYSRCGGTGRAFGAVALFRFVWFDLLVLNPAFVLQHVGGIPIANAAVVLPAALAIGCATIAPGRPWRMAALAATMVAVIAAVRQVAQGTDLTGELGSGETWGYSAALLALSILWLWRGIATQARDLRVAALALITLVTLKVFLIDVAALGGVLRILSFMGLGIALIGIGWAYGRVVVRKA